MAYPHRDRTLDELDPPTWGPPTYPSNLVRTCHRLRTKQIGQMTVEDLRILIGQSIGVRWLIPLALEHLERDPLAEGHFYPGDLLASVLRTLDAWWNIAALEEERRRLDAVVEQVEFVPPAISSLVSTYRSRRRLTEGPAD